MAITWKKYKNSTPNRNKINPQQTERIKKKSKVRASRERNIDKLTCYIAGKIFAPNQQQ
jgi:hypothetical protein